MGKIYKLNNTGTVGVSLTKSMKEAGFAVGRNVEWVSTQDGFVLRLLPALAKPSVEIHEETPAEIAKTE